MERAHRGNYKNPNSPIYAKFLSWKVAQGILESIVKANREGKITIFASQKYSKRCKIEWNELTTSEKKGIQRRWSQKNMEELRLSFQEHWWWKSQQMKNTKFLTVILEMLLFKVLWYRCTVLLGQMLLGLGVFCISFRDIYSQFT